MKIAAIVALAILALVGGDRAISAAESTRTLIRVDGRVDPAVFGAWRNNPHGWILQIDSNGITRWQDTPAGCYATVQDGPTLMAQVEYRYFTPRGDDRVQFEYLPSDGHTVFERRGVDWAAEVAKARSQVSADMSPAALWSVLEGLILARCTPAAGGP